MNEHDLAPLVAEAARRAGLDVSRSAHDTREWRLVSADEERDDTYVRLSGDGLAVEILRSFSPFEPGGAAELSGRQRAEMGPRIAAAARRVDGRMTTSWSPGDGTAVVRCTLLAADVSVPEFQDVLDALDDVASDCRSEASAVLQGVAGPVPAAAELDASRTPVPRRPGRAHDGPDAPGSDPGKAEMVPAIVSTVCCGCLPLGVVAIIFAVQASSHHAAGRYDEAKVAAQRARTLWIISIAFGALVIAIQVIAALAQGM